MTFGEQIKRKREEHGMTQEELAEKLDVSRQAISKWESDLSLPGGKNRSALCELLGLENENPTMPRARIRWLYGALAAALLCALLLCVLLFIEKNRNAADILPASPTEPAITGLRFLKSDLEDAEAEALWYNAEEIRGMLLTYTGEPETVKIFFVPTGSEMTEETELLLTKDILDSSGFILLPLNLSEKISTTGHLYAELRFGSTTVTSEIFNMYPG